jgi:serine/threonine protein kinase
MYDEETLDNGEKHYILKLGDFGLGRTLAGDKNENLTSFHAPATSMDPQLASGRYNGNVDLYSMGLILQRWNKDNDKEIDRLRKNWISEESLRLQIDYVLSIAHDKIGNMCHSPVEEVARQITDWRNYAVGNNIDVNRLQNPFFY